MEYLDKIILFLSCIFEVYIYYDFFNAYFDFREYYQISWKRFFVNILVVFGLFIVNSYGNTYVNLLGFIIIMWIDFIVVFRANIGSGIIYFLIALIIGSGCEFIFGVLLSIPVYMQRQYSVINLSNIPWHMFTMKLLTYILLSIIKQYFGSSKKVMNVKLFLNYLCIPVASFGIMLLTYYTSMDTLVGLGTKALFCLSFALMLLGNIFVFHAFNRYSDELYTSAEQKLIISRQNMDLQYYSQIQMMNNKYQAFIHNISHHLKTIGELAKEDKTNNIISILKDLDVELENDVFIVYCDNSVLNSILSEKKAVAEKNNIKLDIYVEPGTNLLQISDADIITLLSNLLDNAIRAATKADERSIIVRIYSDTEGYFNIIKIINYFKEIHLDTKQGFVSTKNEKGIHGVGIKSVESTAEKYNGYLECFVEEKLFTAVLVLPSS